MRKWINALLHMTPRGRGGEDGMTTAELLGNAALGVAALVAIWALLQALGVNVINWIEGQLGI